MHFPTKKNIDKPTTNRVDDMFADIIKASGQGFFLANLYLIYCWPDLELQLVLKEIISAYAVDIDRYVSRGGVVWVVVVVVREGGGG